MHRLGPAPPTCLDDPRYVKIAFSRWRGSDLEGFFGPPHMQRLGVGFGIDGDGGNAHAPCRADDAACDLAAIGNHDLLKHLLELTGEKMLSLAANHVRSKTSIVHWVTADR